MAVKLLLKNINNVPVKPWISPHNPTIRGDANIFGELIPGRIWSGGIPKNAEGRYPKLKGILDSLKGSYPVLGKFTDFIHESFWSWVPDAYAQLALNSIW